jgi:hypothetical protein
MAGNPFDPTTTQAKKIAASKKKTIIGPVATAQNLADQKSSTTAKMKAAADGKEFGYENPAFDARIMSWNNTGLSGPLYRGYLEQDKSYWKGTGQAKPYRCNFLYNPSVISVSYESNLNVLPSEAQTTGQKEAQALISSMQAVTFSLLFDRTYEVFSLTGSDSKALSQGVYADIAALERCVGIYRTTGSSLGGQGPMLRIPMNLVFGTSGVLLAKPLAWFGFIAGMGVDYTHFGSNMTPMRATASITFSQLAKYASGKFEDKSLANPTPATDATAVS